MKEAPWFSNSVIYESMCAILDRKWRRDRRLHSLKERVPYLHYLGIDCVWLSPFFGPPSPITATTSGLPIPSIPFSER